MVSVDVKHHVYLLNLGGVKGVEEGEGEGGGLDCRVGDVGSGQS